MNLHLQRSVLPAESVETTQDSPFLLFQGGIRESLELDSKDLLYVESNGNYIRVNYQKAGKNESRINPVPESYKKKYL